MGRTIGGCLDDTSLRAAQEHLLVADNEVDASVIGNDSGAAARRSPERALLAQDRLGVHLSIVEPRAMRVQRPVEGGSSEWIRRCMYTRLGGMYERGQKLSPSLVDSRSADS